jgi:hypothetical protein
MGREIQVGGGLRVEGKFLGGVVAKAKVLVLHPKAEQPFMAEASPVGEPIEVGAGRQKNSSSICSNSRVRKVKFPGVISFRKAFPIWQTPKGTFFLEVRCTFVKFTKMPWAVSGRR